MDIRPNQPRKNIGVTRRQKRSVIGDFKNVQEFKRPSMIPDQTAPKNTQRSFKLDTKDINDEQETAQTKVKFWQKLRPGYIRRNCTWRGFFRKTGLTFGAVALLVLGHFGYKLFFAVQNIIDRDSGGALALQGDIDPSQLNGEGDGRVNILLIGIGGEQHEGGNLADTIVIASIDPFNNEVAMLSVPRDLWVDVPGQWTTKINAAHALGEESNFSEDGYPNGGPGLLQKTVEQTLGIPIHYYTRVDFNGFRQAIDAVGSITIDVPETICDYKIAWEFGFSCIEQGQQNLNSNQALFYSRTRASTRGDFDRGERQRLILLALQEKVLSLGTFSDPRKILGLLDAAGNHVSTNLGLGEMRRLYEIGEQIGQDKVVSTGLDDYITTANINSASAVVPTSGNFEEIKRYVRSIFIDGFIKKESASIDILNGTTIAGLSQQTADELATYGYVINKVATAPKNDYTETRLYSLSDDAEFTKRYLEQRLETIALGADQLPDGIKTDAKFVIIVGEDATR